MCGCRPGSPETDAFDHHRVAPESREGICARMARLK
jgi:hypothetical protein